MTHNLQNLNLNNKLKQKHIKKDKAHKQSIIESVTHDLQNLDVNNKLKQKVFYSPMT